MFSLGQVNAQGIFSLENKLNNAYKLYNQGKIKKADKQIHNLVLGHPSDAALYSKVGKFYYDLGRFQDAVYYFEKASKLIKNGAAIYALPLAKSWWRSGAPERADAALSQFPNNEKITNELKEEIRLLKQSINFSKLVGYNTYPVSIQHLDAFVNSEFDDFAPSFSTLNNNLVFTRKVKGIDENFFTSLLDTCNLWSMAEDMGFPINSNLPESYQNRAYSDKYMIYQKCGNRSVNSRERGGCDLYLSYAHNGSWSEPKPFGYTINTVAFEGMPCLNASETALYFSSNRPGGYGGMDIWVSYFVDNYWQEPVNLGPNINTEKDEICPVIAADGRSFFFASEGHPGFGGFDIFFSQLESDSTFTKSQNVGAPINTSYDDFPGTITMDGAFMYMASDRIGTYGGLDIFKAELPEKFTPKAMSLVYGLLLDNKDSSRLKNIPIAISDLNNSGATYRLQSNRGDGSFYICLPKGEQYEITIEPTFYNKIRNVFQTSKADNLDTLIYALEKEQFEKASFSKVLGTFDYSGFSEKTEIEVKRFIKEKLGNFKGTVSKIFITTYYLQLDREKVEQLKAVFIQSLYELGYNDEQILFFDKTFTTENEFNTYEKENKNKAVLEVDYNE